MIDKYIGRQVTIIYQDRSGRLSKRRIIVNSVRGSRLSAYCMTADGPRTFDIAGILAIEPVRRHVG